MLETSLLLLLGLLVGSIGTWVGVGGGFLLVPILSIAYPHWPHPTVVAVSFAVVFANGLSGTIGYLRQRPTRVALRPGTLFALATIPGAIAGSELVQHLPRSTFQIILACVLLTGSAVLLVVGGKAGLRRREAARRLRLNIQGDAHDPTPPLSPRGWVIGISISLAVGFVASIVGIGGGIFHVPAMVFLLDFPVHAATATSQFILAITSGAGTANNIHDGLLNGAWSAVVALAGGAIVGAQIGVRLSQRSNPAIIVRALAIVIAAAAIMLFWRALNPG